MARSHKIYIIMSKKGSRERIRAAFTVKHEMISWCQRNHNIFEDADTWVLCTLKDAGSYGPREIKYTALPDECWKEWVPE